MPKASQNNFAYMFNNIFYDDNTMKQFDKFAEEYANKTDAELYEAIEKAQAEVDMETKKKHIRNLELLAQVEGFVDDATVNNINNIKSLIKIDEASSNVKRYRGRRIEPQFFGASSLLLWFLLVVVLFRGSRFRRPFGRPFGFFPFRPY